MDEVTEYQELLVSDWTVASLARTYSLLRRLPEIQDVWPDGCPGHASHFLAERQVVYAWAPSLPIEVEGDAPASVAEAAMAAVGIGTLVYKDGGNFFVRDVTSLLTDQMLSVCEDHVTTEKLVLAAQCAVRFLFDDDPARYAALHSNVLELSGDTEGAMVQLKAALVTTPVDAPNYITLMEHLWYWLNELDRVEEAIALARDLPPELLTTFLEEVKPEPEITDRLLGSDNLSSKRGQRWSCSPHETDQSAPRGKSGDKDD